MPGAHLKGLTNLTELYIMDGHVAIGPTFDAKITDAGLAHLGDLPSLRSLNFHGAGITDAGLAHLTNLESLEVESSYITDDGLAHLSGLKNLRSLNLPSTDIRGSGLVHLQDLPRLAELNLGWTNISDATLKHLKEFKNLKVLRLSNVNVTEQAVSDLRIALPGCEVEFSPNADGPVMRVLISIARAAMRRRLSHPQRAFEETMKLCLNAQERPREFEVGKSRDAIVYGASIPESVSGTGWF